MAIVYMITLLSVENLMLFRVHRTLKCYLIYLIISAVEEYWLRVRVTKPESFQTFWVRAKILKELSWKALGLHEKRNNRIIFLVKQLPDT